MQSGNQVAIIDYECMTPLGVDVESTWAGMLAGSSGIRSITRYDVARESATLRGLAGVRCAGEIPQPYSDLAGSPAALKRFPEPSYHAVRHVSSRVLSRLPNLDALRGSERFGVISGTALTSQLSQEVLHRTQRPFVGFILNQCHNIPASAVGIDHCLRGPSFSINSACASSAHAILVAVALLNSGALDCVLVLGFEFPVLPVCVAGFECMNALYRHDKQDDRANTNYAAASRPFSRDRRGFVLGEAVGAMLLARPAFAAEAGWPTLGLVVGSHSNSDAEHLTRMSEHTTARCMRGAIKSAALDVTAIGCVAAHATSTAIGDASEMAALDAVFGAHLPNIPVVAHKAQLGHSLGAAAVISIMLAVHAMRVATIPPLLNYLPDDTSVRLRAAAQAEAHEHRYALVNAFGFGGTNVSLVVARGDQANC